MLRAQAATEGALQEARSREALSDIVRRLHVLSDEEVIQLRSNIGRSLRIDCKPGCSSCCFRQVQSTISEALSAAAYIRETMDQAQREKWLEKLHAYQSAGDNDRTRACPFLVDDLCSIYAARPFSCRALSSLDVRACEQSKKEAQSAENVPKFFHQDAAAKGYLFGHRLGLFSEALDHEMVDFPSAVAAFLLDNLEEGYFGGAEVLTAAKIKDESDSIGAPSFASRHRVLIKNGAFPTGHVSSEDEESLKPYYELGLKQGLFKEAVATLDKTRAAHLIANIIVPRLYNDEAEIGEWRQHFVSAMREFAEAALDPVDAFNALSMHRTAGLAYQGMLDKEIMIEHGRIMAAVTQRALPHLTEPIERKRSGKVRVGYISANMHASNGCRWSLGWLKNHGPEIETFALNVGTVHDNCSREFKAHAHHYFHLVRSIPENAKFIKDMGLDILVFTDIGLHGYNTSYATMRLAPVQCTAWGHPITSGYPHLDYYLSSDLMEPEGAEEHYSEALIRLPGSGLTYGPVEDFAELDRSYFGLPLTGKLIVNVQTKPKLLPQHDRLYREIADRTGSPIVFLEGAQPCDTIITKRRMEKSGVPAIWLPHLKRHEFLALLKLADVSLDPPLWSGGNTTIEALSLGTPVVTLAGPWMRSRHSYAFLQQAGAPALIATTEEEYIEIASNFERQQDAVAKMDPRPIFNDLSPVRALDQFFSSVAS